MNNDLNDIDPGKDENAGKRSLLEELLTPAPDEEKQGDVAAFEQDAGEGLAEMNPGRIPVVIGELNRSLRQQLKKKKKKMGLPDQSFVYVTVITVLVLIIIAYLVVRKFQGG